MTSADVVAHRRAAGCAFTTTGVNGFVREVGEGGTAYVHGVPTSSSFLYRKVLDEPAARNLRGVAIDLPGLGLADRREHVDYTWLPMQVVWAARDPARKVNIHGKAARRAAPGREVAHPVRRPLIGAQEIGPVAAQNDSLPLGTRCRCGPLSADRVGR